MNLSPKRLLDLQSLSKKHRGVFSIQDLSNFFLTNNPLTLQRLLKPLLEEKVLQRFSRGFYVMGDFDLEWLSQKINPSSAISLGSVLSKEMMIGAIPQKTVYAVKKGPSRIYKSPLGQVVHLGFTSEDLWFGYDHFKNGIRYATKEKAFLDTLYFYQSGRKFFFNIYSDIQVHRLDMKLLKKYLYHYKNQKFIKFVEGVIHRYNSI